jgi:hypothetical protein
MGTGKGDPLQAQDAHERRSSHAWGTSLRPGTACCLWWPFFGSQSQAPQACMPCMEAHQRCRGHHPGSRRGCYSEPAQAAHALLVSIAHMSAITWQRSSMPERHYWMGSQGTYRVEHAAKSGLRRCRTRGCGPERPALQIWRSGQLWWLRRQLRLCGCHAGECQHCCQPHATWHPGYPLQAHSTRRQCMHVQRMSQQQGSQLGLGSAKVCHRPPQLVHRATS